MFHVVRDGLERDLAEKRARRLFGLGPEVGMSGKQSVENGTGFTSFEPFENRARLRWPGHRCIAREFRQVIGWLWGAPFLNRAVGRAKPRPTAAAR